MPEESSGFWDSSCNMCVKSNGVVKTKLEGRV